MWFRRKEQNTSAIHGFGENTDCGNRAEIKLIDLEVLGLSLFPSPDIDN
jgi:hypothetical protein